MTSTAAMVQELESTRQSLGDHFTVALEVVAGEIDTMREGVTDKEAERDDLLRESASVLRRARAAKAADLSVARVQQIIEGR